MCIANAGRLIGSAPPCQVRCTPSILTSMSTRRPRPYRKRQRALAEEATRLRITEAAVELHGSVGPARTTVTEIAERAGVSRMTVYKHFPSDRDLFVACSTHWAE